MSVSKFGREPIVYLEGREESLLRVLTVEQSMGGGRLDHVVLEIDSGRTGDTYFNRDLAKDFDGKECEVVVISEVGERVVHWGKISKQNMLLGNTIAERFVSTTELHHFGSPLRGYRAVGKLAPGEQGDFLIDEPLVFNPVIDGRLRRNQSSVDNVLRFLDPGQTESEAAAAWHDSVFNNEQFPFSLINFWTLAEAALYLMATLNTEETSIKNMPREELYEALDPGTVIENVAMKDGWFLPQCLDALLMPYGFGWQVFYEARGTRRIDVYRLGKGSERTVHLQPPGEIVDQNQSPAAGFELTVDSTRRLVNTVEVIGSKKISEVTVELIPAWDWEENPVDGTNWETLNTNSDFYNAAPGNIRVGRDYVLNEAGDYIGNRVPQETEDSLTEVTRPFDWTVLFPSEREPGEETPTDPINGFAPRRRRFLPCISRERADGTPAFSDTRGVLLEWSDDYGQTWYSAINRFPELGIAYPIDGDEDRLSFELLEKECGIRWTGTQPPERLINAGTAGRLRITAAIEHDQAISFRYSKPTAINRDVVPLQINAEGKFHLRVVHEQARTQELLPETPEETSSRLISGEADDTEAAEAFCRARVQAWNQLDITGEIPLEGIEWGRWNVGDVLFRITGRHITLSTGNEDEEKFPQIVGIRYDVPNQRTILTLDTWRDEPR